MINCFLLQCADWSLGITNCKSSRSKRSSWCDWCWSWPGINAFSPLWQTCLTYRCPGHTLENLGAWFAVNKKNVSYDPKSAPWIMYFCTWSNNGCGMTTGISCASPGVWASALCGGRWCMCSPCKCDEWTCFTYPETLQQSDAQVTARWVVLLKKETHGNSCSIYISSLSWVPWTGITLEGYLLYMVYCESWNRESLGAIDIRLHYTQFKHRGLKTDLWKRLSTLQ